jgi:hypothetical protein
VLKSKGGIVEPVAFATGPEVISYNACLAVPRSSWPCWPLLGEKQKQPVMGSPNSWMVYFMENHTPKWMIFWCTPMTSETSE